MVDVEKIAEVVLYEGYLLFPYRRSAIKNQQRWTFGGVYPREFSEAGGGDDPWSMQTQCLVVGDANTELEVKVRFLHVANRRVSQNTDGAPQFVERLQIGDYVHTPYEEAAERTIEISSKDQPIRLADLFNGTRRVEIAVPEATESEPLLDAAGEAVGAVVREWRPIRGFIEIEAEDCSSSVPSLYRLTLRIVNNTPWQAGDAGDSRPRTLAVRQTMVSTHTILRIHGGEFVSLLEPPEEYKTAAEACANIKTWPVLVGDPGDRHTILSSPIILYDYPAVSPESPGNLFDGTEIDELLTLSIMTLADEEKQEMRQTDERAREILERTEALSPEQIMTLHASVRGLQTLRRDD